jgi:carboxypeptidase D
VIISLLRDPNGWKTVQLSSRIMHHLSYLHFKIQKHKVNISVSLHVLLKLIVTDFYVNGTTIPDVTFDVGSSWAGLLPISNSTNESRQLYFWYFPSQAAEGVNDLVIWLNGGPGCSRLVIAQHFFFSSESCNSLVT